MVRFWCICAVLGALIPLSAEAARCPHGKILRVSLHRCVGQHSRLAAGYVHRHRTSIRHAHIRHHEPVYYVTVMVPADPPAKPPDKPPDPALSDIPYRLPGSKMDAPTFSWFWPP